MQIARNHILVVAIGVLLGVYTALGGTFFPGDSNYFALSFGLWTAVTFAVGLFGAHKKQSIIYALLVPIIAFATAYVISAYIVKAAGGNVLIIGVLCVNAIIFSPFLGYLAALWKNCRRGALFAPPIIASLFLADGIAHKISTVSDVVAYAFIIIGLALFVLLYKKEFGSRNLLYTVPALFPLAMVFFVFYILSFAILFATLSMGSGFPS